MTVYLRKKKVTNECDGGMVDGGAVSGDAGGYDFGAALGTGMGPVTIGGPDRWDNILKVSPGPRRKRRIRRRKK